MLPYSPFYDPAALEIASRHFSFIRPPGSHRDSATFPVVQSRKNLFHTLELVGNRYADYRSVPHPDLLLDEILELKRSKFHQHIVELGPFADQDSSHAAVLKWIADHRLPFQKKNLSRSPYLLLNCTWEQYELQKKRKFWYNIRRSQKLLEQRSRPLAFQILDTPDQIALSLPRCLVLYNTNWNRFTSSSLFLTTRGSAFLKDLVLSLSSVGKAELCVLAQGDVLLAFALGLKHNQTYYFYLFATNKAPDYRSYSVGKIFLRHLIESVFRRQFEMFDFMAGEEAYKYEWTQKSQGRSTYYVTTHGRIDRALLNVFWATDRLTSSLKQSHSLRNGLARVARLLQKAK